MYYYNTFGWYTSETLPERTTSLAPSNTSETVVDGELRANFTGYAWIELPYFTPPIPEEVMPAPLLTEEVPASITMRQACIQLELDGLLTAVENTVANLPKIYQIEWQRASNVNRDNPLVEMVRQQQGMTTAQIDSLFISASKL